MFNSLFTKKEKKHLKTWAYEETKLKIVYRLVSYNLLSCARILCVFHPSFVYFCLFLLPWIWKLEETRACLEEIDWLREAQAARSRPVWYKRRQRAQTVIIVQDHLNGELEKFFVQSLGKWCLSYAIKPWKNRIQCKVKDNEQK